MWNKFAISRTAWSYLSRYTPNTCWHVRPAVGKRTHVIQTVTTVTIYNSIQFTLCLCIECFITKWPKNIRIAECTYVTVKDKAIPITGREAHRVLRRRGLPLPRRIFLVLISVTGWLDPRVMVRLEGLGPLKNPMTTSWIEPATFRLVTYCLNRLRYFVPHVHGIKSWKRKVSK
jgi:hypothetical protein